MIGVISPSLTAVGYASMIDGIERAAQERDYGLLWIHASDTADGSAEQIRQVAGRVDGIIMASARRNGNALAALDATAIPFMLLNRLVGHGHPSVIGNDQEGARIAVAHFVRLGHSRIALVSGTDVIDTVSRRRSGYQQALDEAGLSLESSDLVVESDLTEAAGAGAVRDLLGRNARPSAILFSTITVALGGLQAMRELRVAVPQDVSVVSFDDSPIIDHLAVPLTAVRMPHAEMGSQATRSLIAHLEEGVPLASEVVQTAPILVVRQSTTVRSS